MEIVLGSVIVGFVAQAMLLKRYKNEILQFFEDSIEELSQNLAQALINFAQNNVGEIEQPNPMQMMIMQLIQERMSQGSNPRIPGIQDTSS